MFMHGFATFRFSLSQANVPEIRPFDDAIVMLRSTNQSENTTVSNMYIYFCSFHVVI